MEFLENNKLIQSTGTLSVRIRSATIFPSSILNRFHILLATLRQFHLIVFTWLLISELQELIDQNSVETEQPVMARMFDTGWSRLFCCFRSVDTHIRDRATQEMIVVVWGP